MPITKAGLQSHYQSLQATQSRQLALAVQARSRIGTRDLSGKKPEEHTGLKPLASQTELTPSEELQPAKESQQSKFQAAVKTVMAGIRTSSVQEVIAALDESEPNQDLQSQLESSISVGKALSSPLLHLEDTSQAVALTHPIHSGEDLAKVWNNSELREQIPEKMIQKFGQKALSFLDHRDVSGVNALQDRIMRHPPALPLQAIAQVYADHPMPAMPNDVDDMEELLAISQSSLSPSEKTLSRLVGDTEFNRFEKTFDTSQFKLGQKLIFALPLWGMVLEAGKAGDEVQIKRNLTQLAELAQRCEKPLIADIAVTLADRHRERSHQHKRSVVTSAALAPVSPLIPGVSEVGGMAGKAITSGALKIGSKLSQMGVNYQYKLPNLYKKCRALLAFALSHNGQLSSARNGASRGVDPNPNKVELQIQLGMDPRVDYSQKDFRQNRPRGWTFEHELQFANKLIRLGKANEINFMRLFFYAGEGDKITRS